MDDFENKIKEYKIKINVLNIFNICIIIFGGVLSILMDETTRILIIILGIVCLKLLWNKLSDLIEHYNYLIYKKQNDKCDAKQKTTNVIYNTKDEKKSNTDYCKECFENISSEQYLNNEGFCEKCYKEKYGEEEHYCEICGRLLTQEEYEDYEYYCEDCYSDINVHYQHHGLDDTIEPFIDAIDSPDVWDDYYDKK